MLNQHQPSYGYAFFLTHVDYLSLGYVVYMLEKTLQPDKVLYVETESAINDYARCASVCKEKILIIACNISACDDFWNKLHIHPDCALIAIFEKDFVYKNAMHSSKFLSSVVNNFYAIKGFCEKNNECLFSFMKKLEILKDVDMVYQSYGDISSPNDSSIISLIRGYIGYNKNLLSAHIKALLDLERAVFEESSISIHAFLLLKKLIENGVKKFI